jgi:AcrR family transcriptional regulator
MTRLPLLFRQGEKGFHGSSLAELARRAGVNGGHIHHHFESKETKNDRAN